MRHHRILVVNDAAPSHAVIDHESTLERREECGAEITTTVAIVYELAEKAGTGEFKRILEVVKERRTHNSE